MDPLGEGERTWDWEEGVFAEAMPIDIVYEVLHLQKRRRISGQGNPIHYCKIIFSDNPSFLRMG